MGQSLIFSMKKQLDLSSAALHILAMGLMLCDHLWATVIPGNDWLTCLGRLAFPIFAFLIVEGYFHTRNLKKYALRLLLLAVLSEIPFNLMYSSRLFNPFHQNVIWTLLMGLLGIHLNELARRSPIRWLRIVTPALTALLGVLLGTVAFVDYNGAGVLTVLVFYFFRKRKWWCLLMQLAALYYLNAEVLSGLYYHITLFGHHFELVRQSLAVLALVPIWLYRGRQGCHSRLFRTACYGFYPIHMLILYGIRLIFL